MSDKLATVVISVVTAIWAANIGVAMIPAANYSPSEAVNGIFMVIVGGTFTARAIKKNGDDSGDPK